MVDFGLAKATMLGDGATRAGQLKGKISYMAPEQVRGDSLDRRADIFALGVVLYAVSTGKHPFRRESEGATLFTISSPDPAPAPSRFMEYPADLEAVLMKAISKDPDKRYSTAHRIRARPREHAGRSRSRPRRRARLGFRQDPARNAARSAARRAHRCDSPRRSRLAHAGVRDARGPERIRYVRREQRLDRRHHAKPPARPGLSLGTRKSGASGLAALALVVGGIAFFVTRKPAAEKAAAPAVSAPLTRPAAPAAPRRR